MALTFLEGLLGSLGLNTHAVESFDSSIFWVKPYLQIGSNAESLLLSWFSPFGKKHWKIQIRKTDETQWTELKIARLGKYKSGSSTFLHIGSELPQLSCGQKAEYRLFLNRCEVFASEYAAPSVSGKNRVVVFGDFGDGEEKAPKLAAQVYSSSPDFVVMPGDLVYDFGRVSEYREFFFPILNADSADVNIGAPLLRSIPFVPVAGNHDVGSPKQIENLDDATFPDPFGYFLFWRGSGKGPQLKRSTVKKMLGERRKPGILFEKFGKEFLDATNYSFNFQNQHWVVLDANKYMDWSVKDLRKWLLEDLLSASEVDWRFVTFHQPPYNSDKKYRKDERMRILGDIFEEGKVDVVYSGHCHFYERHYPLTFRPSQPLETSAEGHVEGELNIDFAFDGITNTAPKGVIYIVTGAGGKLVSEELRPSILGTSPTTCKIVDYCCSYTVLETNSNHLLVRQISEDGLEVDRFEIIK